MTLQEYKALQQSLSALLDKDRLRRKRLSGRERDAYQMGVKACKSALSNFNPDREVTAAT